MAFVDRFAKEQGIPHELYKAGQRDLITKILKSSQLMVAVNPDDFDQILGYMVFKTDAPRDIIQFHFLYVKGPYRYGGIATRLIDIMPSEMRKEHTYKNRFGHYFSRKYRSDYNPYSIWR